MGTDHGIAAKYMKTKHLHPLEKILENRIAIIDGAMGTTIRTYGMKEAAIQTGCNEYITKPIEMEKLEKLLSGYLQYVVVRQNSAS